MKITQKQKQILEGVLSVTTLANALNEACIEANKVNVAELKPEAKELLETITDASTKLELIISQRFEDEELQRHDAIAAILQRTAKEMIFLSESGAKELDNRIDFWLKKIKGN